MELESVRILGIKINKVNPRTAIQKIESMISSGRKSMVFTPNTEIVMEAQQDAELKKILDDADMVIPDGIGLIYASKIHGLGLTDRVPGIELMESILGYCDKTGGSIYLFGSKPGVTDTASENILKKYPGVRISGTRNGYFKESDEEDIIAGINAAKPDFLFVALGAPKQEKWIYRNLPKLNVKVAMGVGGSIDVWAGTVKRAPVAFQKLHLEWFYRLMKEPHRIGRMMSLPRFMVKTLVSKDFSK